MKKSIYLILLISFYSFSQGTTNQNISSSDTNKNEGYFNITKLSYLTTTSLKQELFIEGEGNFFGDLETGGAHAWSIQTINGYFISPSISLGLGIGLDGHHKPNFSTLPIFLDARAYFSDEGNSVYSYIDIGPTLKFGGDNSEFRKGVLFNFGIGYKFNVANNLFLVSDLFYSHKTVSLTDEGISTSDNIIKSNSIGLSIGVLF